MPQTYTTVEKKIVRKGEIACKKQFLFFSQCFLPYMLLICHFKCTSKCRLQFLSIWTSLEEIAGVISSFSHNVFNSCLSLMHKNEYLWNKGLTHYQTTNFRFFQTERVCRRQFDENGSKLSKRVENIVGKGEIARYEQFLLFPLCFQKACFPGASKGVIVWERVKLG